MLSSSPTIQRFTPPTCTLEIKTKKSPLSRWTKKEALKKLHFRLSFDDPRIPESKQVTIKGNRHQLEQLHQAVSNYIQEFLQASFQLTNKPETDLESNLTSSTKPYLKRQGLVSHELFFGSLAYQTSEPQIKLSTVQLFDLVTALEEYSTQIATVPELATRQGSKIIPLWGGMAAAAIIAVGLTITAIKSQSPRNIASPQKSEPSVVIPQLDDVIPPQVSKSVKKTTSQPQSSEPFSSTKKLPPPPAVDTPKPPPNIPDPAKYSLPEVASQSGFKIPSEATIHPKNKANSLNQQTKSVVTMAPKSTAISPAAAEKKSNLDDLAPKNRHFSKPAISQPELSEKSAIANRADSNLALNGSIPKAEQLKEVKAYFKDRWQPPAELKQSLEYRLILNTDGSLQRIVAIGKASEIYLDRTNIPLRGQSFISPLREQESSIIRLLLNPDGNVTAFAE